MWVQSPYKNKLEIADASQSKLSLKSLFSFPHKPTETCRGYCALQPRLQQYRHSSVFAKDHTCFNSRR